MTSYSVIFSSAAGTQATNTSLITKMNAVNHKEQRWESMLWNKGRKDEAIIRDL